MPQAVLSGEVLRNRVPGTVFYLVLYQQSENRHLGKLKPFYPDFE